MRFLLPWLLALTLHGAFAPSTVTNQEPLVVIVNPATSASQLSADRLEAIFTLSQREWSGGQTVIPFNYAPGVGIRETFDRVVLGMNSEEVARFWIDRRIRGMGDSPRKVPTIALMLRVVAKLPGAIGYVPESAATPDVKVVALIKDGKVLTPRPVAVAAP